jgi:hypothetical protein
MPRPTRWREQLKDLLIDKDTGRALVYVVLNFALGCIYLLLLIAAAGFSFLLISVPFVQEVLGEGVVMLRGTTVLWPRWSYALCVPGGILLWTVFMHIARGIGGRHGRLAKRLLVRE